MRENSWAEKAIVVETTELVARALTVFHVQKEPTEIMNTHSTTHQTSSVTDLPEIKDSISSQSNF